MNRRVGCWNIELTVHASIGNHPRRHREKRVLMICAAFPPSGGAGVQRSAKFAKFLPQFGWTPIVWTCGPLADLPRDESLLNELPPQVDVRVPSRWHFSGSQFKANDRPMSAAAVSDVKRISRSARWANGLAWRLDRWTRPMRQAMVPDQQVFWALASVAELRRVIRRERIDVIYSTYSPASNHLLGWLLKRSTGRPWVSDYRDLWTDDCWYPFSRGPIWRRSADRWLQRRFLEAADAMVGVSPDQTRILSDHVPHRRDRFTTIYNGVDLDDFGELVPSAPVRSERFVLAHVGRFTRERVKDEMLEGFARFARYLNDDRYRFELRIVGQMPAELRRAVQETGICCEARGYASHRDAVQEMTSADALLLQYPHETNADTAISGKLFEYFAAGRPILMIGPAGSATRRLVESFEAGIGTDMRADDVCAALRRYWELWNSDRMPRGCERWRLQGFTRRELAGELASVFDATLAGAPLPKCDPRESINQPADTHHVDDSISVSRREDDRSPADVHAVPVGAR